ncbi:MAG: addiction module toxin RelE [Lentisphaerae bacterium RIFOXYB12_FULL_65_16]|nr:MAG: addiction module toxin RelE [Lentisphaerae bacterium RIFOXYA12_64_32]OGV87978.1 MAG: addiction module toxin RelE [Lentisphaerae bacterium RIFOXYB12_FULL_65_16]
MASYRIEWRTSARKELRRLDRTVIPRIVDAVGTLATDPFPPGCRKLSGGEQTYRIRIGDYRVVYEVIGKCLIIEIVRVRHRKDAYR